MSGEGRIQEAPPRNPLGPAQIAKVAIIIAVVIAANIAMAKAIDTALDAFMP